MILRQTIWGALEKNIRLGFRKGCVIPERFALAKQKNHNKRFGEFKFEYFGDSDVANKLVVGLALQTETIIKKIRQAKLPKMNLPKLVIGHK